MRHQLLRIGIITLIGITAHAFAGDWTHWRGPNANGLANEKNLPATWSPDGENLVWKADVGARSSPLVHNGRVFVINRAGEGEQIQERVMALDFDTGKVLWEHRFNVFLTDIVAHRLGWAQLAIDSDTGYIYAHGVQGLFKCFTPDGKIVWERSLTEEFGRVSGYGGRTNSPIVDGDLVIISSIFSTWGPWGRGVHRFIAMDKKTGSVVWTSSPSKTPLDTTYSVPVIADVNGQRLLMAGLADGYVHALKVHTGEPVWAYQLSKRGINASVLYHEGKVYAAHSEENLDTNLMGAVVCIDATKSGDISNSGTIWKREGLGVGYASPAYDDGMLIVADNAANLYALDGETGKDIWHFNYGAACRGSALLADGKIYIGEVAGTYHVIEYNKKGAKRLDSDSFERPDGSPIEIFSSPVAVQGRVILATKDGLYCIGRKGKTEVAKSNPPTQTKIKPGSPAHLQVRPALGWIDNGKTQAYEAYAYDDKGNLIGKIEPTWGLKGLQGTIKADGTYQSEKSGRVQAGMITAKYEGLTAEARLRVIPDLPYKEDFEGLPEGEAPPGWVTSKKKANVMSMDGNMVLRKAADHPSPIFARLRNYMLPPMEAGYTVQADVYGQRKKRFYPDMGLMNCRYQMILMGTTRKPVVRLVTWAPMPRLQVDVPYNWKPDTWYTMKLAYSIKDDKGWVRGKVWPQGEAEPSDWTIEMWDPIPNVGGSPALYAYSVGITDSSHGTEVYFDNVLVTKE